MCTQKLVFQWLCVLITALFIIAKNWKQPKCPSTNEWINKMWYIQYNGILFSHNKEWNNTDTCYNTDEPWKLLWCVKEASHKKLWFQLCKMSRTGKYKDGKQISGCLGLGLGMGMGSDH